MNINKPKIVFLDASTVGRVENLSKLNGLGEYISFDYTSSEERIPRLKGCQIAITNKIIINKEVMDACPDLKLICISATGMNNVDLPYATKKGIIVKNVAGYSTESVAQTTFAMLFHLIHKLVYYDLYVKTGGYSKSRIFTHFGPEFRELSKKRFGIIGMGAIGKRVAVIAEAFGSEIVYNSTSGTNKNAGFIHLSLHELLSSSDIVTIHCPLNENTVNLLDETRLKLMKSTSILINVGRGGIINEDALAKAIDNNWIAGAALDVLAKEPIGIENPLLKLKNADKILITPHVAWTSVEARYRLIENIVSTIKDFLNNP
jgi:lactate dehydrogenase-like 2-hydroxyacid dehydrogenase